MIIEESERHSEAWFEGHIHGVPRWRASKTALRWDQIPTILQQGQRASDAASRALLQGVHRIAKKRFGERTKWWHELWETYGHYGWSEVMHTEQSFFS
ncbi:unnamed protein product [Calypogeia fissa]